MFEKKTPVCQDGDSQNKLNATPILTQETQSDKPQSCCPYTIEQSGNSSEKYDLDRDVAGFQHWLEENGFGTPDIIPDGEIKRFDLAGEKPGGKSGWYAFHAGTVSTGVAGSWKNCATGHLTWCSRRREDMTQEETAHFAQQVEKSLEHARKEEEVRYKAAEDRAQSIWASSEPVPENYQHPYLRRKGICAYGEVRCSRKNLVLAVRHAGTDTLQTVQFIHPEKKDGRDKQFLKGGKTAEGIVAVVGDRFTADTIFVTEGWATACTLAEALPNLSDVAIVAALSAGNLSRVAAILRVKAPDAEIWLFGDNDHEKVADHPEAENTGAVAAQKAASLVSGRCKLPPELEGVSDWNDLACMKGMESVRQAVTDALKTAVPRIPENLQVEIPLPEAGRERPGGEPGGLSWPRPQPLTRLRPVAPPFPKGVLIEPLRSFLIQLARSCCLPLEMVAVAALVTLSAALGRKVALAPNTVDDFIQVAPLYGLLVAAPGSKKTQIVAKCTEPLRALEEEARQEFEELSPRRIADVECCKQEIESLKKLIKDSFKKSTPPQEAHRQRLADAVRRLEELEKVKPRRHMVVDSTVEALGEILAINRNGVLVFRDEIFGLLESFGRKGHENDRSFYNECWNGTGSYGSDRIGRGSDSFPACLGLLGAIPPARLEKYLDEAVDQCGSDGLLSRIQLVSWSDERLPWQDPTEILDSVGYEQLVQFLAVMSVESTERIKDIPVVRFEAGGAAIWREFRNALENYLRDSALLERPAYAAAIAKLPSLFCRLCLVFEAVQAFSRKSSLAGVSLTAAILAAEMCAWSAQVAKKIYAREFVPEMGAVGYLAQGIRARRIADGVTVRDIARNTRKFKTAAIRKGLVELQRLGWLRLQRDDKAERLVLNPYLEMEANHEN